MAEIRIASWPTRWKSPSFQSSRDLMKMVENFLLDDRNQHCLLTDKMELAPHLEPPDFDEGAVKVMLRTIAASISSDHQEARRGVSGRTLKLRRLGQPPPGSAPRGQIDAGTRTS